MEMQIEENIWNTKYFDRWGKTDPAITKEVRKGGRTFRAIDCYQQILIATKEWGPMGKWGFKDINLSTADPFATFTGTFFYPDGEFGICNSIDMYIRPRDKPPRVDSDWGKKLMTDSMTKAFSYLLMNADIFLGKFDDNKYVEERKQDVAKDTLEECKVVYTRCKDLLVMKKNLLGQAGFDKMITTLDDAATDIARLKRAEQIIGSITHEKDPEDKQ